MKLTFFCLLTLAMSISASGHGMGTALSEKIAQKADVLAFLFDQLGMTSK